MKRNPQEGKSFWRDTMEPTDNKLLDQVRACRELVEGTPSASRAFAGQCKHYSIRTEEAYTDWIKRYMYFHDVRHPAETPPGN